MHLTYKERLAQRAIQNRAAFNGSYKSEIDGLRVLSVIPVMIFHA